MPIGRRGFWTCVQGPLGEYRTGALPIHEIDVNDCVLNMVLCYMVMLKLLALSDKLGIPVILNMLIV